MNHLIFPGKESANLSKSEDLATNTIKNINNDFSLQIIFLTLEFIETVIFCKEETLIRSSAVLSLSCQYFLC